MATLQKIEEVDGLKDSVHDQVRSTFPFFHPMLLVLFNHSPPPPSPFPSVFSTACTLADGQRAPSF